ncbi:MAG TPA: OmpA family protein [Azonexus sp.]|nr:OmpA family protein [Azonexus sp.]
MAASLLLNQVSSEFGGDALTRIASTIGESPGKIRTALSDMLPALLGGLASKAQTREGAHELLDVIHRDHLDTAQYEHVADAIEAPDAFGNLMSTGGPLLDTVLPGKSSAVSSWVASHAGIAPAASQLLMSMVLPLVLGLIGRRVGGGGESGLMNLLGKPQAFLQEAPGGLNGVLGLPGTTASAAGAARAAAGDVGRPGLRPAAAVRRPAFLRSWLLPLLVALALIAAVLGYLSQRQAVTPSIQRPVMSTPATGNPGDVIERELPNGVKLRLPVNGVEDQLLVFIEDANRQLSPTTWFSFDRVEFDSGTATLKDSSQEQLRNIAEIMKAYPQVSLKLGGYTDNTGNPQQNQQLSQDRATSAMNQIIAFGIDPARLSAEGYGEQHPVADNRTPEGRQRNRRIDINVTAK